MTSAWLSGRRFALVGVSLLASLVLAAPARAGFSILHAERNSNGLVLSCQETYECTGTGECDGWQCAEVNNLLSVCIPPEHELRFQVFCCETVDDCPRRDGANARSCTHVAGDVSVCLWQGTVPRGYNFCTTANTSATFDAVAACFGGPATGSLSLAQGDCDGDGEPNATDSAICSPDDIITPIDMGVVPDDMGMHDGSVDEDSSVPEDSGTLDHGTSAPPVAPFQGGGGCSVEGSERGGSPFALMLGALALTVVRRRRSR